MRPHLAAAAIVLVVSAASAAAQTELAVFAAGSLRPAMTEIGAAFEKRNPGSRVKFTFGPSGLLKDRITRGERADVFASANMEHPQALVAAGKARAVRAFARNRLCVLAAPKVAVTPETLVDRMLDPAIKLGTSTPKADPSGDYAWMMFERVERQGRKGAYEALTRKALQLTGGPNSPSPPAGRSIYGVLVAGGKADLFVTYCTNARLAASEEPSLRVVDVPDAVNVSADYGVTRTTDAAPLAETFEQFLLGPDGQRVLTRLGFFSP